MFGQVLTSWMLRITISRMRLPSTTGRVRWRRANCANSIRLLARRMVDQCPNQSDQLLMLRACAALREKVTQFNVAGLAPRWQVRLVPDEYLAVTGITDETPPIPVFALIDLPDVHGHATSRGP